MKFCKRFFALILCLPLVLFLWLNLFLFLPTAGAGQIVNINDGGTINNNVYGNSSNPGYIAPATQSPSGNTLNIGGITTLPLSFGAYGGYTGTAGVNANANQVTIRDSAGVYRIYGGWTDNGNATGNQVTIRDNADVYTISSGWVDNAGNATGNQVTIKDNASVGYLYSGRTSNGNATGNQVTIRDSASVTAIYGGFVNGAGNATGNQVTIQDSAQVGSIYGGYFNSGNTIDGNATDNQVTIGDSASVGYIYGGYVYRGNATGNQVTIKDNAQVNDNIYGGYVDDGNGNATGNSVSIFGTPNLSASDTNIYGGRTSGTGDVRTGNSLNLHTAGLTALSVQNFESYNFYLPATLTAGGTVLTLTGAAALGTAAQVNMGFEGAESPLRSGDTITLISASPITGGGSLNNTESTAMLGVTQIYTFDLALQGNNQLLATVAKTALNSQTKSLSEGYLAGMGLVNQGADLIAGQGMESAVRSARAGLAGGYGLASFGTLSGGWSRYNTGSHVDMSSVSLMTGLSYGVELKPGYLTLGAFFEYGNGSYDTYNSFSNAASVKGDGDMYYLGGGILGRMDFINTGPGHFYAEASGRVGGIHNEYSSGDLRDSQGRKADYDSSSAYYGLHLGAGYVWNINDKASLDLYGKYFWTRQEGDSVTLSTGDPVTFKDVDSSRLRFGGRFAYAVNEYVSPYIGAAYEHEFDGRARATTNGFSINAPSLRGDTGIGELGFTLKPSQTLPLSFDLGVQGYVGRREGVTGSLQAKWEF